MYMNVTELTTNIILRSRFILNNSLCVNEYQRG